MVITTFKLKIRNLIFDLNHIFPILGRFFLYGWNNIYKFKFITGKKIFELRGKLNYINDISYIDKIYLVNPQKIRYYLEKYSKKDDDSYLFKKGWRKSKKLLEESPVYQALKKKFKDGKTWAEIDYFKKENNETLKTIEEIYNQIKINGFKSKLEKISNFKDIIIAIDKNGHLINLDGIIILSIAKILNINQVPISIVFRDKNWINFKKKIGYFSRNRKLYQFPIHPDLQEFSFSYGESRFDMIKENLSISKGTLLDIGANFGFFCHKFEDEGFECYAVELNWMHAFFLKKLKKAEDKKFKIITNSIFSYNKNKELKFDVILALNVFHHFLKRKNTYNNLVKLMNRIKVKEFFFGAHNPQEFRNFYSYRNYRPEKFVDFLLKNSHLKKAKLIGKTENGRSIYKLSS